MSRTEYFRGNTCTGTATRVGSAVKNGTVTNGNGTVPNSVSTEFSSAGSYCWEAIYSGDANNNPATSKDEPLTVSATPDTLTATLSSTTIEVGSSVIDSVYLSDQTGNAGGNMTYFYYSGSSCSLPGAQVGTNVTVNQGLVPNSATQQFNLAGHYTWKAFYSGDANNLPATSECEKLTVNKASPAFTPSLSSTAIVVDHSVSDSATTNGGFHAGGTVTYWYYHDSTCKGTASQVGFTEPVSSGKVGGSGPQNFTSVGPYSWEIRYSGDSNNNASTGPCQFLAVNGPGASILTHLSANTIEVTTSATDSATLSGTKGTAGGTVQYEYFSGSYCSGTPTLVPLPVPPQVGSPVTVTNGTVPNSAAQTFGSGGSYSWNAVYSGDARNNGATSQCEPLTVSGLANTTITVSCLTVPKVVVGSSTKCTATVQSPGSTPTGKVTWSTAASGKFSPTTCTLSRSSSTCTVKFTPDASSSSLKLTANYLGDIRNSQSSGTYTLGVTLKPSKITVSCSPGSAPANSTGGVFCRASVRGYAPTGTVTWGQSGAGFVHFVTAACTLSRSGSCSVTLTGARPGSVLVNASYGGDSNNIRTSGTHKFTVGKASTTIDITCSPATKLTVNGSVTCTANVLNGYSTTGKVTWSKVSGSGGVTFDQAATTTCQLAPGSASCSVTITAAAPGSVEIEAAYSGDKTNNLGSSGTLTLTIDAS